MLRCWTSAAAIARWSILSCCRSLAVLDVSAAALRRARHRLGARARRVRWIEADVLEAELAAGSLDIWHDRAVFHFLTSPADRAAYVRQVRHALRPGGFAIVATFAEDGPERCSGLPVARYSPAELHDAFGAGFQLLQSRRESHRTPSGGVQRFAYCLCRHLEPAAAAVRD